MKTLTAALSFYFALLPTSSFGANLPGSLPRAPLRHYLSEGFFSGGSESRTTLRSLHRISRPKEGVERWIFDFTAVRSIGSPDLPKFQLRYVHRDPNSPEDATSHSPRFVFHFQAIEKNQIRREQIEALIKNSPLVRDVLVYPAIEHGDTAVEFILKQEVVFEPFQPGDGSGRLILDIKAG